MKTVTETLMDLVSIPSVSNISNRAVVEYAQGRFDPAAWKVNVFPYQDSSGVDKFNLVALTNAGEGVDAELGLVCHTDTVPFDDAWSEATARVERDGNVWGRGSCDVKGFLACILTAVSEIDVSSLRHKLAVVLTADEEVGCIGAKRLAAGEALRAKHIIIGEPTGLTPVHAGKGYALGEIVVKGKEAHSAFPQLGRSAIRDAARVIARLDDVAKQLAASRDTNFDPPYTTLNVGLIRGGTAKNIVPGECRFLVEWRPIPGQPVEFAAGLIREQLASLARELRGFEAEFEIQRMDPGFRRRAADVLRPLLESVSGRNATTVAFGTEASHLASICDEAVVFGPGDMNTAHRTGERVPVHELHECVRILKEIIASFCRPGTR